MAQPVQQRARTITMATGISLFAFGCLALHDLLKMPQERLLPARLDAVMFLGPAFVAAGIVTLLRGVLSASPIFRRAILALGLLMLIVGGFPWVYTPYITGDRQEGAGMLGTMTFIFVGLPGIATILAWMVLNAKKRHKATIIVLCTLTVIGLWFTKSPRPSVPDPKETATHLTITKLAVGLVEFRSDMDRYPTSEEGLTGLILNNGSETWKGPYLDQGEIPTDEWGNEFSYINKGSFFSLLSLGQDGKAGTKDDLEFKTEHSQAP